MRLNLPWWLNPWAEVRRLRDDAFARALAHGSEVRALRAEADQHRAMEDKAVRALWDVQSYASSQLRAMRFELGRARCEADAWRKKVMEITSLMPPPVQFIRKEET